MDAILEEAIREAYASANEDTRVLYTVEIRHHTLTEPIRIARYPLSGGNMREFRCMIEDGAETDASSMVTFLGVPFEITLPEKSMDTPGTFEIMIPYAGPIIEQYLENAALGGGVISATFRTYIEGREDEGPVEVWPDIHLQSPSVDSTTGNVSIEGSVLDWINRKFGRLIRPGDYPALVGRSNG